MFRLESKILQREFVVHEGTLYASQIRNVLSGQDFFLTETALNFYSILQMEVNFLQKGLRLPTVSRKTASFHSNSRKRKALP